MDGTGSLEERLDTALRHAEQLAEALRSADVIGMAKGILIAREGCSPNEAFTTLVKASQRENRKVREIAAGIVLRNVGREAFHAAAGEARERSRRLCKESEALMQDSADELARLNSIWREPGPTRREPHD
jgi:hypothetical protein